MKKFLVVPLALLALAASALPASAARTAQAQPTITISPSVPVVGDYLTFAGCGYKANSAMEVTVSTPWDGGTPFINQVRTDAGGCWSIPLFDDGTSLYPAQSGDYLVSTYAGSHLNVGGTHPPLATLSFTVA